jgi:hypothetical protein
VWEENIEEKDKKRGKCERKRKKRKDMGNLPKIKGGIKAKKG